MKKTIVSFLSIITSIIIITSFAGCSNDDSEYRRGLRRAAELFQVDQFDLDDWVSTHGGSGVSYSDPDPEKHTTATAEWRKGDFIVEVGLTNGDVRIIQVKRHLFIFEDKSQVDSWNTPNLSTDMIFIPNGKGYAVSADIKNVVVDADARVDELSNT